MDLETRIAASETKQFKVVFPNTLNANESLFGGTALQWMDEVAYITATRFTRMKMFTVSTEKVRFLKVIKSGMIAEISGKVNKVGNVKLNIQVEIFVEDMFSEARYKAVDAIFTFAAVDNNHQPIRIDLR